VFFSEQTILIGIPNYPIDLKLEPNIYILNMSVYRYEIINVLRGCQVRFDPDFKL